MSHHQRLHFIFKRKVLTKGSVSIYALILSMEKKSFLYFFIWGARACFESRTQPTITTWTPFMVGQVEKRICGQNKLERSVRASLQTAFSFSPSLSTIATRNDCCQWRSIYLWLPCGHRHHHHIRRHRITLSSSKNHAQSWVPFRLYLMPNIQMSPPSSKYPLVKAIPRRRCGKTTWKSAKPSSSFCFCGRCCCCIDTLALTPIGVRNGLKLSRLLSFSRLLQSHFFFFLFEPKRDNSDDDVGVWTIGQNAKKKTCTRPCTRKKYLSLSLANASRTIRPNCDF